MNVRVESLDFIVSPSVVPADCVSKVTIRGTGHYWRFYDELRYTVQICPLEYHDIPICHDFQAGNYPYRRIEVQPVNGVIEFEYCFVKEQEWEIVVYNLQEDRPALFTENRLKHDSHWHNYGRNWDNPEYGKGISFRIYSLAEDLYRKRPFAGDLHLHSNYSDGKENPEIVAANMRRYGCDFCAITDHHTWEGSVVAQEKLCDLHIGFRVLRGEEVHNRLNGRFHLVNLDSSYSVNEKLLAHPELYWERVKKTAKNMIGFSETDALELAWFQVIAEEIRRSGGFSVYAHPYWTANHTYFCSTHITEEVLKHDWYDAWEVLGGCTPYENNLQVALYYELKAKGYSFGIVASTDAHRSHVRGVHRAGETKTIVFSDTKENVLPAVRNGYSVVSEQLTGEHPKVYGDFRLVKYTIFLMQHYYPVHDRLCEASGILLAEYLKGDRKLLEAVEAAEQKIEDYSNSFLEKQRK